jgi:hypothetical protein
MEHSREFLERLLDVIENDIAPKTSMAVQVLRYLIHFYKYSENRYLIS